MDHVLMQQAHKTGLQKKLATSTLLNYIVSVIYDANVIDGVCKQSQFQPHFVPIPTGYSHSLPFLFLYNMDNVWVAGKTV